MLVAALYVGVTITTVPWIMTRAVGTEAFMKSGPQDALKAASVFSIIELKAELRRLRLGLLRALR